MKWLAIAVGLAVLPLAVCAQDALAPLPDWVLRMARVKHHLRDNFAHIPNYVCKESIDRYQKSPRRPMTRLDSLEFEVGQVDHKELLARPGFGFEDRALSSLVPAGVLGTGQFSVLPINLFVADGARVTPHPRVAYLPSVGDGEGWDYEFSASQRGFEIVVPGVRVHVGERGTFWVDPQSMDLSRIDEEVVDMPPETGMSASTSVVEYMRVQIGGSSVLLPRSAVLTVVNLNGNEFRNEIKFSGCREYSAESTVRFGDTVDPPKKK